jgi:hypothetical protein
MRESFLTREAAARHMQAVDRVSYGDSRGTA